MSEGRPQPEGASGAEPEPEPAEPEMLTSGYLGYECFQNYTGAEVFVQGLAGTVSREDTEAIIRAQKVMLQRFEKTNAMLTNCNSLSAQRLQNTQVDFKRHVQMLTDVKKDLNHIFERIRKLKSKLAAQYPKQFAEATNRCALQEEDEEAASGAAAAGPRAASASASPTSASGGGVRRREHPKGQASAGRHPHRHSYHAGVPLSSGPGEGRAMGAVGEGREAQQSEPAPHSSSDSEEGEDVASQSSTNS